MELDGLPGSSLRGLAWTPEAALQSTKLAGNLALMS